MQDIICELQDMKHLDWAARKMSPGTPGCFLKAYEEVNGKRLYYKYRNKIWEMIWKMVVLFLNRYAIRRNNRNKIVGILNYDEKAKKYTIEIPVKCYAKGSSVYDVVTFEKRYPNHEFRLEYALGTE